MPVLNLVVAVLRGSIGRVIAVLRDRLLLLSLLVERFVLTLINEEEEEDCRSAALSTVVAVVV